MKFYKAFNRELKCRNFQFEEGKEYKIDGPSILCEQGFHFCKALVLTLEYYPVGKCITENKYAEIEVLGDLHWEDVIKHKGVTNHIRISRVLADEEVLELVDGNRNSGNWNSGDRNSGNYNSGDRNSGYGNSGDRNSGNYNSGDCNSGYGNSGDRNSGDRNSGYSNSGDRNSGYKNSGDCNSGNYNSGDCNSGYGNSGYGNSGNYNSGHRNSGGWNSTNNETGFFNSTQSEQIRVFNRNLSRHEWYNAEKPDFLHFHIDEEIGYKESFKRAYENSSQKDKDLVLKLPNFDAEVFYEISGIDLR